MAQSIAVFHKLKIDDNPSKTEGAVNLEDVYKGICNLVSQVKDVVARDTEVDRTSKINQFLACQPPSFGHDTDPLTAKLWIYRLELLFRALDCLEEQKVPFATLKLEDTALTWWVGMERGFESDGVQVPWEKFKELFYERYYPQWLQQEKLCELLNLVQGDKTVAEYDAEFMKLSSLSASFGVADGKWKAMLFERGLRPDIRTRLICLLETKTYFNVRELALIVEHSCNELLKLEERDQD